MRPQTLFSNNSIHSRNLFVMIKHVLWRVWRFNHNYVEPEGFHQWYHTPCR